MLKGNGRRMAGFHNIRIYTIEDNRWCKSCWNGEYIVGNFVFTEGAYVCHCGAVPTKQKCSKYVKYKRISYV